MEKVEGGLLARESHLLFLVSRTKRSEEGSGALEGRVVVAHGGGVVRKEKIPAHKAP